MQRRHCPRIYASIPEGIERWRSSGQRAHSQPMSNSKIVEEAGTSSVDASNTVQERLSQDELTAEQEEETKAALEEAGAGKMEA